MHRDLNPNNILVKIGGPDIFIFKICDFGLCTLKEKGCGSLGTTGWQAPELENSRAGEYYDSKVDIFALGLILLHLLNGKNLYKT